MTQFPSVLWHDTESAARQCLPDMLTDLNLHRIIAAVLPDGDQEPLREHLRTPLRDVASIDYRHEIFRDLEHNSVREPFITFVRALWAVRRAITESRTVYHPYQQRRFHLDAALAYCRAVVALDESVDRSTIASRGLREWLDALSRYLAGAEFQRLVAESTARQQQLSEIRYRVAIKDLNVYVDTDDGGPDYTARVAKAFAPLQNTERPGIEPMTANWPDMNHVEEQILDRVVAQHPDQFRALDDYYARFPDFLDTAIDTFADEILFYLLYSVFVDRLTARGLPFCYPEVTASFDGVHAEGAYDLALGLKLLAAEATPVQNDFQLSGTERVFVVTGPNQGGKSTFARMFGQLAHLAAVGCPVPARRARILLTDNLSTHFERLEQAADPAGRLQAELVRMQDELQQATDRSIVIMNESFSSTTAADARVIGADVLRRIIERGAVAVYVTFLDELADLDPAVVSMVAGVGADPTERTFRIERRRADGNAHAAALATRFGLTYDAIAERIAR
ncbi:MutS-related protein [Nocardia altamirensis]|uniref:MutS-related protein n=1 Tax=Nocardia altamirensis TaxID=472158 RepID=UPI000840050C|nr:hypothetical protein [Nocardia altamirensis]